MESMSQKGRQETAGLQAAHGGAAGGLDNRFGVVANFLVRLDEGRHILCGDLNVEREPLMLVERRECA